MRDIKEVAAEATRRSKCNLPAQVLGKRLCGQELEEAECEVKAIEMGEYRSVLQFH